VDADEFWETQKMIGPTLDAMAAHIVSGDEGLARELAETQTREELITIVLWQARLHGFAMVERHQQAGMDVQGAKEFVADRLREMAALKSLGSDEP
jgi:hypothetical protein